MNTEPVAIHSSILSFPNRGPWGKSNYRGNCSGHVQAALIKHYRPKYFCDPSEGSGTSRDVCRDLGVQYSGLDLHSGFNLLRDRLRDRVANPDFIFWHPPYGEMIQYSGNMWGNPHPDDLSRCGNGDEFLAKMEIAIHNIYDALAMDGHYSVLIGDMRKAGEYHSWQADIIGLGIGKLRNVLIKTQHNCVSDRRQYSGSLIPLAHEYLMIFSKDRRLLTFGEHLLEKSKRLNKRHAGTWRQIVTQVVADLGGQADLEAIYAAVNERIEAGENQHVRAKVRQVLQCESFQRLARGSFRLAA